MKQKAILVLLGVIVLAIFSGCTTIESPKKDIKSSETPIKTYEGKRLLYIDSYHAGYEWSDGITRGIENIINNLPLIK